MKILVYGAGALGSLMIHYLLQAGNDVTVVARSTYDKIKSDGIIIKHYIQRKTTVDKVNVVKEANMEEEYDMVISLMQSYQHEALKDTYCKLKTKILMLVGNNTISDQLNNYIHDHATNTEKTIIFGFQGSAGHREENVVVCGRLPTTSLVVGGLHEATPMNIQKEVTKAFKTKGYQLTWVDDMYAFYHYHMAEILPFCYLSYQYNYDLKKATSKDIKNVVKASSEAFKYLQSIGIKVIPEGEEAYYYGGIKTKIMYLIYRIMGKTFLGNLMVADHTRNGYKEMIEIHNYMMNMKQNQPGGKWPTWDAMSKIMDTFKFE